MEYEQPAVMDIETGMLMPVTVIALDVTGVFVNAFVTGVKVNGSGVPSGITVVVVVGSTDVVVAGVIVVVVESGIVVVARGDPAAWRTART